MTGTPRTRLTHLRREWAEVHPGLRPAVASLLCAGVLLGVIGAVGDAAGVWSRFPFLTNLASSLTAALFGLPVALVVVQRLLHVQTQPQAQALEHVDENFPADLPRIGARQVLTVRQLLDAIPATQLAALLPESDTARADLTDSGLPLPLPTMDRLEELRGRLGELVTYLDRARQIAQVVNGVHAAAGQVSSR